MNFRKENKEYSVQIRYSGGNKVMDIELPSVRMEIAGNTMFRDDYRRQTSCNTLCDKDI